MASAAWRRSYPAFQQSKETIQRYKPCNYKPCNPKRTAKFFIAQRFHGCHSRPFHDVTRSCGIRGGAKAVRPDFSGNRQRRYQNVRCVDLARNLIDCIKVRQNPLDSGCFQYAYLDRRLHRLLILKAGVCRIRKANATRRNGTNFRN